MFKDGFHNIVDIYPYKYDYSRNNANNGSFDTENIITSVICRIRINEKYKEIKIFFNPDIKVEQGFGIWDKQNKVFYTIVNVKPVYTFDKIHHITCFVQKSPEKAKIIKVGEVNE